MIGHNNGPPLGDISDTGGRARLYYWRRAHKAAWRTPPIEIVRLRSRAAEQLGLTYKDYTSILLDRGRRPSAIFFVLEGTLVRARSGRLALDGHGLPPTLMPGVGRKLQRLGDCAVFVVSRGGASEGIASLVRQVGELCGIAIADHSIAGGEGHAAMRAAIADLLHRHRLPPSQAVLVGSTAGDEKAGEEAGLARFLWAWHYFAEGPAGTS
jgi:phosphoglycolate phosphatase-like HAD superfamily hydrolase